MIETIAFEMGLDSSDIQTILHWRLSVDIKPMYRKVGISEETANKKIGKAFLHHHMILLRNSCDV